MNKEIFESPSLLRRLRRIKAVVVDVDGVLTDGGMYYTVDGEFMKKFNAKDGMGIKLLRQKGIKIALVSGEKAELIKRRAEKLAIEDLYLGVEDKTKALREFIKKHNLGEEEVAYIGDDINDLGAFKLVGFSCAVADAVDDVKERADFILPKKGGEGALREFAQILLKII